MKHEPKQPLWYQGLGFRFGGILAVMLVSFDLLRRLLEHLTLRYLGNGFAQTVTGVVLFTVLAVVIAIVLAFAVSNLLTERLRRICRSAVASAQDDELPDPLDESGNDELALMASALNMLRERVRERSKVFALKDIRRREWIAQVSHDLRTPLMAQAACLDQADLILSTKDMSTKREELRELLTVARLDGDRVHTLADDLLEIARLDAGDHLHLEPVPPGELVRQAVQTLEPLAAQRGVRIQVNVTARLPMLNADGRRLMRAIENLVRNAIQHARSSIEVIAAMSGESVRFEVRDDGDGLPKSPDFLDYLRRRSSEVRLAELARRGTRRDSAGLGLVVAQRVVEVHHGVIDAYNLSRGGAAFWMDIPVTEDGGVPLAADAS